MQIKEAIVSSRELTSKDEVALEKVLCKLLRDAGINARIDVTVKRTFHGLADGLWFRLVPDQSKT